MFPRRATAALLWVHTEQSRMLKCRGLKRWTVIQLVKEGNKERFRIFRRKMDIVVRARREESQLWRHSSKSRGNGLFRGKGPSQDLEQERPGSLKIVTRLEADE